MTRTLQAANGPRVQTLATPWPVVRRIEGVLGMRFSLDVCAEPHTAKAPRFYTREDDGLRSSWWTTPDTLWWCNPEYVDIARWVGRALHVNRLEGHRGVLLVPARTGMEWFRRCREEEERGRATVAFWPGRIAFEGSGSAPYEYSVVIGIGAGLSALRTIELPEVPDLFSEVAS